MQCMKCGREIPVGQVFCEECLAEMAAYPVKPGTVVTLPNRPKQTGGKKSQNHRPSVTLEQQVKRQGKIIRALSWLLTLSTALLIAVGALTVSLLTQERDVVLPGQNYSAVGETKEAPAWDIDHSDFTGITETESTTPTYAGINGLGGN